MSKVFALCCAAMFAAAAFVGMTSAANAGYRHHHGCCGPIAPSYSYHTTHAIRHVTRFHDVSRTSYVHRTHAYVHVTEVRPIVYVHNVTRVHHHTVELVRPVYVHRVHYLPTEHVVTNSVVNTYDCRCSYRRCHHGW